MIHPLPYRKGVGIMLLNSQKDIFIGQRKDNKLFGITTWQMPQGGIEENESPEQALWRELKEEIGTTQALLLKKSQRWLTYDFPDDWLPHIFGGQYKGQKQKWFLLSFTGKDQEINVVGDNHEFITWKWISPLILCDFVVDFKRDLYKEIMQEFLSSTF